MIRIGTNAPPHKLTVHVVEASKVNTLLSVITDHWSLTCIVEIYIYYELRLMSYVMLVIYVWEHILKQRVPGSKVKSFINCQFFFLFFPVLEFVLWRTLDKLYRWPTKPSSQPRSDACIYSLIDDCPECYVCLCPILFYQPVHARLVVGAKAWC